MVNKEVKNFEILTNKKFFFWKKFQNNRNISYLTEILLNIDDIDELEDFFEEVTEKR